MPAVGFHRQHTPLELLPAVPTRAVNHIISLDKYYRSAHLLLRQVSPQRRCTRLAVVWPHRSLTSC
jgi:hypothetical protein